MAKLKSYVKQVSCSFKGLNPFRMFHFDGIISAETFRDLLD